MTNTGSLVAVSRAIRDYGPIWRGIGWHRNLHTIRLYKIPHPLCFLSALICCSRGHFVIALVYPALHVCRLRLQSFCLCLLSG
jgi:hypothetical protein